MHNLVFFGDIDLTSVVTTLFVVFFLALVVYLRREDRREGYPLEDELTGRLEPSGSLFFTARPKTFLVTGFEGGVTKPNSMRDPALANARPTARAGGSPIEPVGNPFHSGVGPNSIAQRANWPDRTVHGDLKIAPMRTMPAYFIDKASPDPRGMPVIGADGIEAGVVSDVWADRAEFLLRYIEVELAGSGRHVLVPKAMADVSRSKNRVKVRAVLASQFADAPALENPDQITFLEEERVCAYFGAGLLYATPERSEPYL